MSLYRSFISLIIIVNMSWIKKATTSNPSSSFHCCVFNNFSLSSSQIKLITKHPQASTSKRTEEETIFFSSKEHLFCVFVVIVCSCNFIITKVLSPTPLPTFPTFLNVCHKTGKKFSSFKLFGMFHKNAHSTFISRFFFCAEPN